MKRDRVPKEHPQDLRRFEEFTLNVEASKRIASTFRVRFHRLRKSFPPHRSKLKTHLIESFQ
jgi:hypothetical protein